MKTKQSDFTDDQSPLSLQAMKTSEIGRLFGSIVLGIILIWLLTFQLSDPSVIGIITDADPNAWQSILPIYTSILIISAIGTTLWWIFRANTTTYVSSRQALARKLSWKTKLATLYIFNILTLAGFFIYNQASVPINLFIVIAILFLPIAISILYWLPTAIATPRTLRYIPTGSTALRNLIGD